MELAVTFAGLVGKHDEIRSMCQSDLLVGKGPYGIKATSREGHSAALWLSDEQARQIHRDLSTYLAAHDRAEHAREEAQDEQRQATQEAAS